MTPSPLGIGMLPGPGMGTSPNASGRLFSQASTVAWSSGEYFGIRLALPRLVDAMPIHLSTSRT
ncbi:hypothetical protein [Streptomyces hiroshimensis]|uniref:hypothetical protein n=1 Tax=Streptomyces hiroshimensis TaxID=66424 RepID=UPI0016757A85|nr:hypothetical protein [Streptomyces hiroshimensis]